MGEVSEDENRSKIYVSADSKEEAMRIFSGFSVDAQVEVPMSEDSAFAMFRDRFGIEWVVEYNPGT